MLALLLGCVVFVAVGVYNTLRAWRWTAVPEGLQGREHLIPLQVPAVLFFTSYPVAMAVRAVLGAPPDGSARAVVAGIVGGGLFVAAAVLMVTTYYFGRPQRIIAPIARDVPKWSPARRRAGRAPR
jgi:hypothetical protein